MSAPHFPFPFEMVDRPLRFLPLDVVVNSFALAMSLCKVAVYSACTHMLLSDNSCYEGERVCLCALNIISVLRKTYEILKELFRFQYNHNNPRRLRKVPGKSRKTCDKTLLAPCPTERGRRERNPK